MSKKQSGVEVSVHPSSIMWPDLFHSHNMQTLIRILRRSDESMLEIITTNETKVLIEYMRLQKVWKVEQINSDGYVTIDFPEKIKKKDFKKFGEIDMLVLRKKYNQEHAH